MNRFVYRVIRFLGSRLSRIAPPVRDWAKVTDRHWEYPYALRHIAGMPREAMILDVGCTGSMLPGLLAALGYRVIGLDRNEWRAAFAGFQMLVGDLKAIPLRSASVDVVTAISTIEHCGLERYGERSQEGADRVAMEEIARVLRRDGTLVLTVPFGRATVYGQQHRVYDDRLLAALTEGWVVVDQEFYGPVRRPRVCAPISHDQTYALDPEKGPYCITCAVLRKAAPGS